MTVMQGSLRPYSCYVPPQRVAHDLSERQRRVLALLGVNQSGLVLREVGSELGMGVPEWEIKENLALFKRLGLVQTAGHGHGAYWFLINHGFVRDSQ